MKKAINLQAEVQLANIPNAQVLFKESLSKAFAQVNPEMRLNIKSLSKADAHGKSKLRVYLEGEQEPAANFTTFASSALHKAIAALLDNGNHNQALKSTMTNLQEVENEDENQDVVLPPPPHTTT